MAATSEKSVDELRAESERTRAELTATVGALRERVGDTASELKTMVSPAHIKQEIKDYVRQERESLVETVQRKAKENPLQMAAIGAAVAYPALNVLRAVPMPLWLIGAGLFLTSKRGEQTMKDVQAKVDGAVEQASGKVSEVATSVQSEIENRVAGARASLHDARDAASAKVGSLTESLQDARDAASAKVGSLTEQARAAFHEARNAVTGATAQAGQTAEATFGDGAEAAGNLKDRASDMANDLAKSSRNAITDFVKDNPLLVAGLGAAVGAFVAASIPSSEAENRLFGSGSEKLKDKARETVAQGIEKAGDAAASVAGAAAEAAAREGLDASGMQDALNKAAGSVRRVADRGLDAALGGSQQPATREQPTQDQQDQQPMPERTPT